MSSCSITNKPPTFCVDVDFLLYWFRFIGDWTGHFKGLSLTILDND